MTDVAALVADNIHIWTGAIQRRSGAGRGGGKRISLYGIERLRALILDLAVRGKLVPQDAGDEPASDLLKRIDKSKATMIRDGVIRKPRDVESKNGLKQPFPIPNTWQWVRLAQVGAIIGGGTPSSNDAACFADSGTGIAWLTPADLGGFSGRYIDHGARDLTDLGLRSSSATLMPAGSVLFTSRAPIGYVAIAEKPVATNQGFKSVVPFIVDCSLFVATALKSFAKSINDNAPGTTFKEVSGKIVSEIPFPLPPLAEQRRIVAKVDELMALCDALERESADSMATHQALVEALLATLVDSADAADLARRWARLESHFDILFTTDASIDALKRTVLNLAVRGKLAKQDPADEDASLLLERIRMWQAQQVVKKNIRLPRKSLRPIAQDEKPVDLPLGWSAVRLGEIIYIKSGDGLTAAQMRLGDVPVYGGNGINGYHNEQNIFRDTIVIGRVGFYCGSIHVTPRAAWVTDNAFITHFDESSIYLEFLRLLLSATNLKEDENATAQPVISGSKIYPIIIGLPPLAEQHRIVSKVDALIALCDQLKCRLADATETQRHLADAITERAAA